MNKPLKAISNVIELKPGRHYLFVLQSEKNMEELKQDASALMDYCKEQGIKGVAIVLKKGDMLEVIEKGDDES